MISDRDANLGIQGRRVPLVEGSILVTQTQGKTPEMVLVERVLRGGVEMINLANGRPFSASLGSLAKGRVGRSVVVGGFGRNVDAESVGDKTPESKLDTDMVIVTPKGTKEQIFTIVSGFDSGNTILSTPERPDRQMLRIPTEDILRGESDSLQFTPVPAKFSLLKVAHLPDEQPASREARGVEEPVAKCPEGVISRDVETGAIIGDSLPKRTIDQVVDYPNAVFLQGMKMAAVKMAEEADARGLAALMAFNAGIFARLPILNRGD